MRCPPPGRALAAERWGATRPVRIARELVARASELPETEGQRLLWHSKVNRGREIVRNDQIVGGFGGACRSMMSPGLQRKLAEQEAAEEREARKEERSRAERVETLKQKAIQAAITQALE